MREETRGLLKKFEQDYEITVDAQDREAHWVINARVPKNQVSLHYLPRERKYITTQNLEGRVLLVLNPLISDDYVVETWGEMDTFEEFVKKALARILADKITADNGETEGCGTSCA